MMVEAKVVERGSASAVWLHLGTPKDRRPWDGRVAKSDKMGQYKRSKVDMDEAWVEIGSGQEDDTQTVPLTYGKSRRCVKTAPG